jgi:hypothetical protein
MSREELRDLTVSNCENKDHRATLFQKMLVFLGLIHDDVGIPFTVWVDGSFTTEKPEPEDIDIMLLLDDHIVDSLPPEKAMILDSYLDKATAKARFQVHLFHQRRSDVNMLSYWRGWFGFYRDEQTPKGIAVLECTP